MLFLSVYPSLPYYTQETSRQYNIDTPTHPSYSHPSVPSSNGASPAYHHPPVSAYTPAASQYPPGTPRITISPYSPWSKGGSIPKGGLVPHGVTASLPDSHPGYQTDIVIDPYAKKEDHIVQITTSDLSTGLQVGHTRWSGPGSLTLSAVASLIRSPSHLLHPTRPISRHQRADYELVSVPPAHRTVKGRFPPPPQTLGSPCYSHSQCSATLRAVCGSNPRCQLPYVGCAPLTCQCPAHHTAVTNPDPKTNTQYRTPRLGPKRRKRSLRYYQECRANYYYG